MEVWRGERIGGPSGSGGIPDDYGPGLYLATTADLGRLYAIMRADDDPRLATVLGADVAEGAFGRVLDLTQDPRWAAYLAEPTYAGSRQTNRQLLPPTGANETNTFAVFERFLFQNGLRLTDYDTIIGPEFIRNGVQICVRNPTYGYRIRAVLEIAEQGAQIPPWNPKTGFGGAPPPRMPAGAVLTEADVGPPPLGQPPRRLLDIDLRPPSHVKAVPKKLPDLAFGPPQNVKPGPKGGGGGGAPPAAGGAPPPGGPAGSGGSAPPTGAAQSAGIASTPGWHVGSMASPIAPDAYGDAKSGAVSAGIDLLFVAYNRRNATVQKELEQAERRRLQAEIDAVRNARPELGVLLIVSNEQTVDPTGFSQGKLGPRFAGIQVGYGRDAREAEAQIGVSAFSSAGAASHFEKTSVWIEARRPVNPPPPAPPFPAVSLATFRSPNPTLIDVAWALTPFGFDDLGTMPLDVPPGFEPRFYVLKLPATMESAVPSVANPGFERGAIAQTTRDGLPVARLDVYVPFDHDTAAAIYPADAATAAVFQGVPATRHWRLLDCVPGFDLVRWVSVDQITVIPDRTVFELLER